MVDLPHEREIIEALHALDAEERRRMLEFARALKRPEGEPGWLFLERTRDIHVDPADLEAMSRVIEEACASIDPDDIEGLPVESW